MLAGQFFLRNVAVATGLSIVGGVIAKVGLGSVSSRRDTYYNKQAKKN